MSDPDFVHEPTNVVPDPPARFTFEGPKAPLFQALAEARKHYLSLTAGSEADVQLKGGGGYKHTYADLDTVIKALTPGWVAAGLAVIQMIDGDSVVTIVAKDESSLTVSCPIPRYETPQQMGSGTTYVRRYQLKALCCVNDSEDDDANSASGNKAQVTRKEPTTGKTSDTVIPETLAKQVYEAAKMKELPKAEFLAMANNLASKPWVQYDEADARKLLEALKVP